jgi:hypothetical protein
MPRGSTVGNSTAWRAMSSVLTEIPRYALKLTWEVSFVIPQPVVRYPGYALKLTWEVPFGKAMGTLKVNACWHDIVFRNEWGFTERHFLY